MRKPRATRADTEWGIKKQVKIILEDTGWKFWMPNAGAFSRSGVSDFLAMKHPGLFMAVETKYKDVVTSLQHKFLTDVYAAGHLAFLVDETNVEEFRRVLKGTGAAISLMKWQHQNGFAGDIKAAKLDM